jgi:hypothetical protein
MVKKSRGIGEALTHEKGIKTVKVKGKLSNKDTDEKIILKLILTKDGYVWTGFI